MLPYFITNTNSTTREASSIWANMHAIELTQTFMFWSKEFLCDPFEQHSFDLRNYFLSDATQ